MPSQISSFEDHNHTGKCPTVSEIQREYIHGIEFHFFQFSNFLEDSNSSGCRDVIESLLEWLPQFWFEKILCMQDQLNSTDSLKIVSGISQLSSSSGEESSNLVSSLGLYIDTLILTDPVLVALQIILSGNLLESIDLQFVIALVADGLLKALAYREVVTADLSLPICVFMPELFSETEITKELIQALTKTDATLIFGQLFGKKIRNFDHLSLLLKRVKSFDEFDKRIVSLDAWNLAMTKDSKRPSELIAHLNLALDQSLVKTEEWMRMTVGEKARFHLTGRLTILNELVYRSWILDATPLVLDDEYWSLLQFKFELESERFSALRRSDSNISRLLATANTKSLKLLTNVPVQDLIALRKEGALVELRRQLFEGIRQIEMSNLDARESVEKVVSENINDVLKLHSEHLELLARQEKDFLGKSILPLLANTLMLVSGAIIDDPTVKAVVSAFSLSGLGKTIKSTKSDWDVLSKESHAVRNSASAIFIKKLSG